MGLREVGSLKKASGLDFKDRKIRSRSRKAGCNLR